mmetsp:Transcript_16215/g.50764  ORF Transcript_16215/g.50764 Transcript_16215/m.50764 type:complete len:212 (-) Transcript_16215:140-775(-)
MSGRTMVTSKHISFRLLLDTLPVVHLKALVAHDKLCSLHRILGWGPPFAAMANLSLPPLCFRIFLLLGHSITIRLDLAHNSSLLDRLNGYSAPFTARIVVWIDDVVPAHHALECSVLVLVLPNQGAQIPLSHLREGNTRGVCKDLRGETSPVGGFDAQLLRDVSPCFVPTFLDCHDTCKGNDVLATHRMGGGTWALEGKRVTAVFQRSKVM